MASLPATDEQLLEVMLACDEFRGHWSKFRSMPFQPLFEGGVDDILALDYLEYEGLGFPRGGDEAATLVWGNVLVRQVGFVWVNSNQGDLFLSWGEPSAFRTTAAVWPMARVREGGVGGFPQFDRFVWLARSVVAGCLADCAHTDFESRLRRFFEQLPAP